MKLVIQIALGVALGLGLWRYHAEAALAVAVVIGAFLVWFVAMWLFSIIPPSPKPRELTDDELREIHRIAETPTDQL